MATGRMRRAIARGHIPPTSTGPAPQPATVRVLNAGEEDAEIRITAANLSIVPVVVQQSRLDSRPAEVALLGTRVDAGVPG